MLSALQFLPNLFIIKKIEKKMSLLCYVNFNWYFYDDNL